MVYVRRLWLICARISDDKGSFLDCRAKVLGLTLGIDCRGP